MAGHVIPVMAAVVAAEKVIASPDASPNLLLLMFTVVCTTPVLEIPVKPPVVAVEVLPLKILLLMNNDPNSAEFVIPIISVMLFNTEIFSRVLELI